MLPDLNCKTRTRHEAKNACQCASKGYGRIGAAAKYARKLIAVPLQATSLRTWRNETSDETSTVHCDGCLPPHTHSPLQVKRILRLKLVDIKKHHYGISAELRSLPLNGSCPGFGDARHRKQILDTTVAEQRSLPKVLLR